MWIKVHGKKVHVPCSTADKPTHTAVRKGLSAMNGAWLLPASFSLPDAELTCHFPCAVKAFVTVIACFLFLLISLSREWSSRIESAMVCDSTVLLRLRWQPAVFWLTECSSEICMKLFFHGSAGWWKEEVEGAGGWLSGHSGAGRLIRLCLPASAPVPCPWPGVWWGETTLVLTNHLQFLLISPKKSLSINANCDLRYMNGNLEWNPWSLEVENL